MSNEKNSKKAQPIACHSRQGIGMGALTYQTIKVGTGVLKANEMRASAMTWHPLGVLVEAQGRTLVIPASRLDWIEVEG